MYKTAYLQERNRLAEEYNTRSIHRLPEELIVTIMKGCETRELLVYETVCKRWREILHHYKSIWRQKVTLEGSAEQVMKQWTHIKSRIGKASVVKLSLTIKEDNHFGRFERSNFQKSPEQAFLAWDFPFETLESFEYNSNSVKIDQQIWNHVNRCEKLKRLVWISNDKLHTLHALHNEKSKIQFEVSRNLQVCCKLQDFVFRPGSSYKVDKGILPLLFQAELIEIDDIIGSTMIKDILHAACKTLKSFHVHLCTFVRFAEPLDMLSNPVQLDKLHTLKVGPKCCRGISAPNLESLSIRSCLISGELSIIDSCKGDLKELELFVTSQDRDKISNLILGLPKCIKLTLIHSTTRATSPRSTVTFWKDLITATMRDGIDGHLQTLPLLQELAIYYDPHLDGSCLVDLLRAREYLRLPRLQKLSLLWCDSIGNDAVVWLKENVNEVKIDKHQGWKDRIAKLGEL